MSWGKFIATVGLFGAYKKSVYSPHKLDLR